MEILFFYRAFITLFNIVIDILFNNQIFSFKNLIILIEI